MVPNTHVPLMLLAAGALVCSLPSLESAKAWAQADAAQVAEGKKVYKAKKCAVCHVIKGKGGKLGGDLSNAGAKRTPRWLHRFLKNPKAVNPQAKMPPFRGSGQELDAVVAYMASLK